MPVKTLKINPHSDNTPLSKDFQRYLKDYIPRKFHNDIVKAYILLKQKGCTRVYLFGSLVKGKTHKYSDIDIGIQGLPGEKFIRTACDLDKVSNIPIDLVDFDFDSDFFCLLKDINRIKEIA